MASSFSILTFIHLPFGNIAVGQSQSTQSPFYASDPAEATMELTPHSLRSPVSPFDQQSKPQQQYSSQRPYYPTTPQSDSATPRTSQNRGLGVYGCGPLPQSTLHEMPPSPQPSGSWPHASMMEHEFPQSSQPPDIFTAAYDPFSGFSSHSNTGMPPGPSPEAPGLVYCHSPNSNLPSHRSSVSSSFSPSDSFSQNGSDFLYTPKVKMEEAGDWYPSPAHDHGLIPHELSPYSQHVSPVSAPAEEIYRSQQMDWSRPEVPGYPIALQNTDEHRLPKFDSGPILASVTRIKKKRQRTTPEEATHECRVCGKLFKRSYNWKSHMQTHNPKRDYPHPCKAMVGNVQCTKKFQRKTDLERHNDSVSF